VPVLFQGRQPFDRQTQFSSHLLDAPADALARRPQLLAGGQ
jgi:hypothetical protein